MRIEVEVLKFTDSGNNGLYTLTKLNSIYAQNSKRNHNALSLGTTMIDIEEPRKKKLVYQWLFQHINGKFDTTPFYYGKDERDKVRVAIVDWSTFKEGGILRPLMESEKEIEI
jgi:hypothetical protein